MKGAAGGSCACGSGAAVSHRACPTVRQGGRNLTFALWQHSPTQSAFRTDSFYAAVAPVTALLAVRNSGVPCALPIGATTVIITEEHPQKEPVLPQAVPLPTKEQRLTLAHALWDMGALRVMA